MNIKDIKDKLRAKIIEGEDKLDCEAEHIYASDLMSDVLAFGKPNSILLTGLASQQSIISAHMAEFKGVVLIRGKQPKEGAKLFAQENGLILLTTDYDMFDACVKINSIKNGQKNEILQETEKSVREEILLNHELVIEGNDFANAGMASTEVKSILKKIGVDPQLIRRIAISTYEGEMNVVMHALRAKINLMVSPTNIEVIIDDEGKGIPDVDLAMEQGYTTATEEMRAMGFGSGMGLPNIKKASDLFEVDSHAGKGTRVRSTIYPGQTLTIPN